MNLKKKIKKIEEKGRRLWGLGIDKSQLLEIPFTKLALSSEELVVEPNIIISCLLYSSSFHSSPNNCSVYLHLNIAIHFVTVVCAGSPDSLTLLDHILRELN